MRSVGLTGGIGTGKSTVARMFEELGAVVIDADAIVHELQAPGSPLLAEIAEAFGAHLLDADGALDREALGAVVFEDPDARARLNGIMHPPVGAEMGRRMQAARATGSPLLILDIPLLLEGRRKAEEAAAREQAPGAAAKPPPPTPTDTVVVVYAPEALQIERQMERDGCDRAEAQRRVNSQLCIEEKRRMADFVIDNSGRLEDTRRQVEELFSLLIAAEP